MLTLQALLAGSFRSWGRAGSRPRLNASKARRGLREGAKVGDEAEAKRRAGRCAP
jgi:hypothetical protein